MLRVVLGHARPDTEWSSEISELEFSSNPSGGGTQALANRSRSHGTGDGFGTNTILTVPRSQLEHEVDIEAGNGIIDENSVHGTENEERLLTKEKVESA
jgi:hypothetical protein